MNIDGITHRLNADFINETIFVSDQLSLIESQAASLLQQGMDKRARYGVTAIETAIILHFEERRSLLHCLQFILKGAMDEELEDSGLKEVIGLFTLDEILY